jgi:hypothetical protein
MSKIYILSFFIFTFFTSEIFAQKKSSLKNVREISDTLKKFYSNFYLDGMPTSIKEITYKFDIPTKSKNDIQLSDSVYTFIISHKKEGKISGTIRIEIDVFRRLYMFSSMYSNNRQHFESRTSGCWKSIEEEEPNYIYSPKYLLNLLSK